MKRSQQKRITQLAKIVRFMRMSRGISQKRAAERCDLSEQAIGHYENGRMDISPKRLDQFLKVYNYSQEELEEYLEGKPIPINVKDDCISLLNQIDETKLRAVHAVLMSFSS